MKSLWPVLVAAGFCAGSPLAQAADESAVLRLDPALDGLVAPDARVQLIHQRASTFEGPTWVPRRGRNGGYLLFADVPGDAIEKLEADGTVSHFLEHIFAGKDAGDAYSTPPVDGRAGFRMLGANGITLDPQGRIVYCAYSDGQIVRLERDGTRTVLAGEFGGQRINAPNDVVVARDGTIYFTDTRAGTRHPQGDGVPHKGLYAIRDGRVRLLSKDIDHPNGVALSPDQKQLYVANTFQKNVLRFDLVRGGLANETVFATLSGDQPGLPDGIKVDRRGNVYVTGPGGVWIVSPAGRHLGSIHTPTVVNNLAFGGERYDTIYMTGTGTLYSIALRTPAR